MMGLGNQHFQNDTNIKKPKSKPKNLGALIDECLDKTFTMTDFFTVIEAFNSEDRYKQHFGIIGLRKILSNENNPPIQPVIDANLVPRMISFLSREEEPRLQLEAAWAITNIASGTTQQMQSTIDAGVIPSLIKLLSCGKHDIIEQAIWALGNISGDSTPLRDTILKLGGLDPLISFVDTSNNPALIKVGVWAMSNLCRGRPLPTYELTKNAVPILSKAMQQCDDIETLTDAAWALSYLSDGDEKIEEVAKTNIVPTLVKLLQNKHLALLIPVLRIIGNILTGNEAQTNLVLDFPEVLDRFYELLSHAKKAIRREVCWALSNLAAGTPYQLDFIIRNSELITKLISLSNKDVEEIRREACWTLKNLTNNASPVQMAQLFDYDILQVFCILLTNTDHPKILELALNGIDKFISYGETLDCEEDEKNAVQIAIENYGTIEKIENLQSHPNSEVYHAAVAIIEKYFQLEDIIE